MKITSRAFKENSMIPRKYTCEGEDICPPLLIVSPPERTKSLAIMVVDPDAPSNHDFVHWIIWNIDGAVKEIMEGTIPTQAIEGTNDFGKVGYGGPCPPSGRHRYEFHLYALDSMIDLTSAGNKNDFRQKTKNHVLEEAFLAGLYEKTG